MLVMISYRFTNKEKHRYYRIIVAKDLLGDWIVTKIWGGINQKSGRATHTHCSSFEIAKEYVEKMAKIRKQHGYELL